MTITSQVLVVDVDLSARNGLIRLLRSAGYDARGFASVEELLHALDPDTSGCMVLDAETVGSAGEELPAALKARGTPLPIIMVSADDDDLTRRLAHGLNAVCLFRKPVDGPALLDAVKWAQGLAERA
jgi:FixJ family two-component response regulator